MNGLFEKNAEINATDTSFSMGFILWRKNDPGGL